MINPFDTPPKLLYESDVRRRQYWKRFPTLVLGVLAAAGAYWALSYAQRQGVAVDALILNIGRLLAILLGGYLAVLGGLCLYRAFTRPNERIRVYDQGVAWKRGTTTRRYKWGQLQAYREGAQGLYIGRQPLLQWGAHQLKMDDGRTIKVTHVHGDARTFKRAVSKGAAKVTSTQIARALRNDEAVTLHPKLKLFPGGVEARGKEISWAQLNVRIRGGQLVVEQLAADGKFKPIARFATSKINNLGGFMQLAYQTIRNYQPQRFNIKTHGTG
jgi:hypothetical protein